MELWGSQQLETLIARSMSRHHLEGNFDDYTVMILYCQDIHLPFLSIPAECTPYALNGWH